MHPYFIPTVSDTKQKYRTTLKPYTDKVTNTIIDDLKANFKGVNVVISVVENEEGEILGEIIPTILVRILFQGDIK